MRSEDVKDLTLKLRGHLSCSPVPPAGILREAGTHSRVDAVTPHQRLWLRNDMDALRFHDGVDQTRSWYGCFPLPTQYLPQAACLLAYKGPHSLSKHFTDPTILPKSCSHSFQVVRCVGVARWPCAVTQSTLSCTVHIYLFLAALGLHCSGFLSWWYTGFSSSGFCYSSQALEHRLNSDIAQKLSCFLACGINQDQGSNPCPLLWQADSNLWTTREGLSCPTWSDAHDSPGRQIFISLFYRCSIILSLP